jgi:hypothetical protein
MSLTLFKIAAKFRLKLAEHNATKESVENHAESLGIFLELNGKGYDWNKFDVLLDKYEETKNISQIREEFYPYLTVAYGLNNYTLSDNLFYKWYLILLNIIIEKIPTDDLTPEEENKISLYLQNTQSNATLLGLNINDPISKLLVKVWGQDYKEYLHKITVPEAISILRTINII